MVAAEVVEELEHPLAARDEQKIVASNVVAQQGEHRVARARVQDVARREVDLACIVDRAPRREALARIGGRKRGQIGYLATERVDDTQRLARSDGKGRSRLRRDSV